MAQGTFTIPSCELSTDGDILIVESVICNIVGGQKVCKTSVWCKDNHAGSCDCPEPIELHPDLDVQVVSTYDPGEDNYDTLQGYVMTLAQADGGQLSPTSQQFLREAFTWLECGVERTEDAFQEFLSAAVAKAA